MVRIVLAIFIPAFLACSGASEKRVAQEQGIDVYAFINQVLTDTTLGARFTERNGRVISDVCMFLPPINTGEQRFVKYLSDVLSEEDTIFVKKQLRAGLAFTTDSLAAYGFTIARVSELKNEGLEGHRFWERIHSEYGREILTVSRPVFDKSFAKAYIRIGYYCGSLCGGGVDVLLEKINGQWRIKETLGSWIS